MGKSKHRFALFTLLVTMHFSFLYGQFDTAKLQKDLVVLHKENTELRRGISFLNSKIQTQNAEIEQLQKHDSLHSLKIEETANVLGIKINDTEKNANRKITNLSSLLSRRSLYWIIAFLTALLLLGGIVFLLNKRQKSDKFEVIEQITQTKKSLEEEGIKLDTKLTEVLETQLKLLKEERNTGVASISSKENEPDHSLALKVADEIMRINKNITNMDQNIKGLKQLSASVERIKDNFAANGYDMPELLGKSFNVGMKVIVASSIPDETLKQGEEVISRIVKPQVNYKGVMIQAAHVEVSIGQKLN